MKADRFPNCTSHENRAYNLLKGRDLGVIKAGPAGEAAQLGRPHYDFIVMGSRAVIGYKGDMNANSYDG